MPPGEGGGRGFKPHSRYLGLAQYGLECFLWKEEVAGSNPASQTCGQLDVGKEIIICGDADRGKAKAPLEGRYMWVRVLPS